MAFRIISLGWGVQSWGLAAMSALGELPPIDAAVHADTGHERSETYAFAARWTPWLEQRGVRVVTVHATDTNVIGKYNDHMLPAFTTWPNGTPSGRARRECTGLWKLAPIRRWLQANRNKQPVDQWLGITFDEVQRMRDSDVQYIRNRYPYIEDLDADPGNARFVLRQPPMRRSDVIHWLEDKGLEVPVKSSCVFCPFHDRATWREIKQAGGSDWEQALAADESIRHQRENYVCYLTRELKPLAECDFASAEDHGQLTLDEVCGGDCFL